jgi:hypothetical protein
MKSFAEAINRWPSLRVFAEDIGVDYVTAQVMRHRDSISDKHWLRVVSAAEARGIDGVTLEFLAALKAARRAKSRPLASV